MIIKVCGIHIAEQYDKLSALSIDWLGLNLYEASSRYTLPASATEYKKIKQHVGVVVNKPLSTLPQVITDYQLDYLQLHGDEDEDYLNQAKTICGVIKVYAIKDEIDIRNIASSSADYHLLDYKSPSRGGAGKKWDWELLRYYESETPFLIAGGIGPDDAKQILQIEHPQMAGIDINSGFEISPGIKNVELIGEFIDKLSL